MNTKPRDTAEGAILTRLSNNLKSFRKKKDLSQNDLSVQLGIKRATLAAYEECRAFPNPLTLCKISNVLDTSLDLLIKGKSVTKLITTVNFREHRATFKESMETLTQVSSKKEILAIALRAGAILALKGAKVKFQEEGFDTRLGAIVYRAIITESYQSYGFIFGYTDGVLED
jgi:transcriptional regulator with XRE-family HTH domain